jgi:hypothetical protein
MCAHSKFSEFWMTGSQPLAADFRHKLERLPPWPKQRLSTQWLDRQVSDQKAVIPLENLIRLPGVNYFGRLTSIILAGGSEAGLV